MRIGRFETIEYAIPVAGRTVRLLGPQNPWAEFGEPEVQARHLADGYSPYWTTPWVSAVMVAEYAIANVTRSGEPVLEIGAGLGLAGIAMALAGHRVIVTDYDESALEFVQTSAALNNASLEDVRILDWRKPPDQRFSLIIGADVGYEAKDHKPVADLLVRCLAPRGMALIGDPNRATADHFEHCLHGVGLSVTAAPVSCPAIPRPDAIDGRILNGRVFVVRSPEL